MCNCIFLLIKHNGLFVGVIGDIFKMMAAVLAVCAIEFLRKYSTKTQALWPHECAESLFPEFCYG